MTDEEIIEIMKHCSVWGTDCRNCPGHGKCRTVRHLFGDRLKELGHEEESEALKHCGSTSCSRCSINKGSSTSCAQYILELFLSDLSSNCPKIKEITENELLDLM